MMNEKTVLVTGATSGIGYHVAAELARRGARVIVTGRDARRGESAVAELRRFAGHDRVPAWRRIWPVVRFFQKRASAAKAVRIGRRTLRAVLRWGEGKADPRASSGRQAPRPSLATRGISDADPVAAAGVAMWA